MKSNLIQPCPNEWAEYVSVAEVVKASGTSAATLKRYGREGLIPKIEVRRHPTAPRGNIGILPRWVLKVLEDISALRAKGFSLPAIKSHLSGQERESVAVNRARANAEAKAIRETEIAGPDGKAIPLVLVLSSQVHVLVKDLTGNEGLAVTLASAATEEKTLTEALMLVFSGACPVLLYGANVTPTIGTDFSAALRLNDSVCELIAPGTWWPAPDLHPRALLSVPLLDAILRTYAVWKRPLAGDGACIWPALAVWHVAQAARTITEYQIRLDPQTGNAETVSGSARPVLTRIEALQYAKEDADAEHRSARTPKAAASKRAGKKRSAKPV